MKELRGTLQQGTFLRIEDPYRGNTCAWEFVSRDGKDVLFMGYTVLRRANRPVKRWRLRGLEPGAFYRDKETGLRLSGSALMNAGIIFPEPEGDFTSRTAHLVREDG